jgi:hypothetical protein
VLLLGRDVEVVRSAFPGEAGASRFHQSTDPFIDLIPSKTQLGIPTKSQLTVRTPRLSSEWTHRQAHTVIRQFCCCHGEGRRARSPLPSVAD